MKRLLCAGLATLMGISTTPSAAAASSGGATPSYVVDIYQQNESGLQGRARIRQEGADVVIVVSFGQDVPDFYKLYIAEGSCDGHVFDFIYNLAPIRNGVSKTRIQNARLETLLNNSEYMIAIPSGACGDLASAHPDGGR